MTNFTIQCNACSEFLSIPVSYCGQKINCHNCGKLIEVPDSSLSVASYTKKPPTSKLPHILIASAVTALLLFCFLILWLSNLIKDSSTTNIDQNHTHDSVQETPTESEQQSSEHADWNDFIKENAQAITEENYPAAINKVNDFIANYPQSKQLQRAQAYLLKLQQKSDQQNDALEKQKQQDIATVIQSLDKIANLHIQNKSFDDAKKVYLNYSDKYQDEIIQLRRDKISAIDLMITEEADRLATEELTQELLQKKRDTVFKAITQEILTKHSLDTAKRIINSKERENFPELVTLCKDLENTPDKLKDYFSENKGNVLNITIKGKPTKVLINTVYDDKMKVTYKSGKYKLTTKVSFDDLSIKDHITVLSTCGKQASAMTYGIIRAAKNKKNRIIKHLSPQTGFLAPYFSELLGDAHLPKLEELDNNEVAIPPILDNLIITKNNLIMTPAVKTRRFSNKNNTVKSKTTTHGDTVIYNVKLENTSRKADALKYKVKVYIIGSYTMIDTLYSIYTLTENVIDIPARQLVRTVESSVDVTYKKRGNEDIGVKYHGYLAVLESDTGEIFSTKSSVAAFEPFIKEINKLNERDRFKIFNNRFKAYSTTKKVNDQDDNNQPVKPLQKKRR